MLTRHAKLITPLCILLEKRNLTEAADTLALSKSATSKILKKAREVFNDPLLERQGNAMLLTPAARDLLPKLQRLRTAAAECFPDQEDTSEYQGQFSILMPPGFVHVVGDRLIVAMIREFPKISLNLASLSDHFLEQLASGEVDIVVYIHADFSYPFNAKPLFPSQPGLFIPRTHPLADSKLNFEQLYTEPLVCSSMPVRGAKYEAAIKLMQPEVLQKNMVFQSDDIPLLFRHAQRINAIALASPLLAFDPWIKEHFRLTSTPNQMSGLFQLMSTSLLTHSRTDYSPLHRKASRVIEEVLKQMNSQLPSPAGE